VGIAGALSGTPPGVQLAGLPGTAAGPGKRYPGLELAADQAGGERKMKDHAGHVALHPGG